MRGGVCHKGGGLNTGTSVERTATPIIPSVLSCLSYQAYQVSRLETAEGDPACGSDWITAIPSSWIAVFRLNIKPLIELMRELPTHIPPRLHPYGILSLTTDPCLPFSATPRFTTTLVAELQFSVVLQQARDLQGLNIPRNPTAGIIPIVVLIILTTTHSAGSLPDA